MPSKKQSISVLNANLNKCNTALSGNCHGVCKKVLVIRKPGCYWAVLGLAGHIFSLRTPRTAQMSFNYDSTAEYSAYFVETTFMLGNSLRRMDVANRFLSLSGFTSCEKVLGE